MGFFKLLLRPSWEKRDATIFFYTKSSLEASRGATAQSVTVKPTGCGFDPHSMK